MNWRKIAPWVLVVLASITMFAIWNDTASSSRTHTRQIGFSELVAQIDENRVHDVTIAGNEVTGHFIDNRQFTTYIPSVTSFLQKIENKNTLVRRVMTNIYPLIFHLYLLNFLSFLCAYSMHIDITLYLLYYSLRYCYCL